MASQPRRGGGPRVARRPTAGKSNSTIMGKFTDSKIVSSGKHAAFRATIVARKLLRSTGMAAWIAGTTFLILAVPLIIEMDREQQLNELELQQQSLLGAPPTLLPQK